MPWEGKTPKDDSEYLERMSKAIFNAGLNWRVVDSKWSNFRRAFSNFSPTKVSRLTEAQVRGMMKDTGIVRNEKKIRATVENAKAVLAIEKEFGSVKGYLDSFGGREKELQAALQERFRHVGPSTARMFLWMVGHPLTPTKEEKAWMKGRHHEG
jgi:DNA-3-methyladenine glycosylase I